MFQTHKFYIVNNEKISTRVGSDLGKDYNYTVSGRPFVCFKDNERFFAQMISDVNFSMITPKNANVQFHIVAIKTDTNPVCKQKILNYFNKNEKNEDISIVLTFEGHIGDCLKNDRLCLFEKNNKDIHLNMMVNDYEGNLYISNPEFADHRNW